MYILHLSEVKGAKDEPSEVQMWVRTCRILDGGLLAAFFYWIAMYNFYPILM